MLDSERLAGFLEGVRHKLRTMICPNDRLLFLLKLASLPQRMLHRMHGILGRTRCSNVIRNDGTVVHINEGQDKEKAVFSFDIAVFDVHLPKLVGACDGPVTGETFRVPEAQTALWAKKVQLFTQAVHLLMVYDKPVLSPERMRKLPIAIGITVARNEL